MKKIILFLIAVVSSIFFAATAFAIEGEGTEEAPFLITNQEELLLVNDFPDCHFKMMNDIVLEGEFVPLCKSSDRFTGVFDGNRKTISNLTIKQWASYVGLFYNNDGVIKNLDVVTSEEGVYNSRRNESEGYSYSGILVGRNYGEISNCKIAGVISTPASTCGGVIGYNSGTVKCVSARVNVDSGTDAGGIIGRDGNNSVVMDSYFVGSLSSRYDISTSGGVVGQGMTETTRCYVVATHSCYKNYPIGQYSSVNKCFYDSTVSGLSGYSYGKTTLAMKMKKTYTDAGWDFENVWGIDANINDGYPYLLWEYPETGSANAEIIGVTSTDDSLKFISETKIEGEPEISSFGTTFIPLWLFETGSGDVATVEYDNAEHNIQNAQTFGATLTGIPESCKNMAIVGKSFIKDASGNYTWSAAKSASVNDATLKTIE